MCRRIANEIANIDVRVQHMSELHHPLHLITNKASDVTL